MLSWPGSQPIATAKSWTSCELSTEPDSTSQVFRIFPRSGRMAWKSLSRACLALPPAESPSTRNNSVRPRSCRMQSANLPGSAGPWVIFLRTTCFSVFSRACARAIAICAMASPCSMCWFSHSEKASCAAPSTKAAACRELRRSLVWPLNCGSPIFRDKMKLARSQTSSGASFTPRGSRLRKSQNSRSASVMPERRPLTWVPCCAVGIRLT